MAHELGTTNGKTSMFYTGETPWHGLGTKLEHPATSADAIVAAGLNYTVGTIGIQTIDGQSIFDKRAVIASRVDQAAEAAGFNEGKVIKKASANGSAFAVGFALGRDISLNRPIEASRKVALESK